MKKDNAKSKKNWLKWILISLVIVLAVGSFEFMKFQKESDLRRQSAMIQQEKMLEFWKSESLNQDQIDQKLKEQRSQFVRNENPSIFQSVFRTVRHATGTGPGVRDR